jgi:hypothetical protein
MGCPKCVKARSANTEFLLTFIGRRPYHRFQVICQRKDRGREFGLLVAAIQASTAFKLCDGTWTDFPGWSFWMQDE